MFTPAELQAAEDAFQLHAKGRCPDDCGYCYDLLLAGEPKYDRELKRIADIKAARRAGSQTLVKPTAANPEWSQRTKPKETKSKFKHR